MQESDVHQLALCGVFENTRIQGKIEETHISWVILTRKYAFKIKKPLKLAFLDFSTLALRKAFCEKELSLNSRFTNIYLSVQPVWFSNGRWCIGGSSTEKIVDYCVVMKRMSLTRRMDNKLRSHKVSEGAVRALAAEVAAFHNTADKVFTRFDPENAGSLFNDIETIRTFASDNIGKQFKDIISQSIEWSDDFLARHRSRIQERIDQGLKRDVHGDLHSRNIFLYRKPVLFDCIEFNDEYRQIDVLYEIAFLCMDLEAFHHKHLAEVFLEEYKKHFAAAFQTREDYNLFDYFKSLRANVRAKVHVMSAMQAENPQELSFHTGEARKYLALMNEYIARQRSLSQVMQ